MFDKCILYEYNADDEEPECMRCDHITDDYKCSEWCGSKKGQNGYIRTDRVIMTEEERQRCLEIFKRLTK